MEMQPCRSGSAADGSGSGDEHSVNDSLSSRAQGWLSTAMSPITSFQAHRAEVAARKERMAVLQQGATMKLLSGKSSMPVHVQLSADGSMVIWQAQRGEGSESGVLALSMIREVKVVVQGGILRSTAPVPLQWMMESDEETVKMEAESERQKETWISTLTELCKKQAEAKAERKIGYATSRRLGLEERRREAERRKAEVMKTCGAGGMKHTAAAMMNRLK